MYIEYISKMAECTLLLIKISRFISKTKQIRNNCKWCLYIILNVLSNKTNLIYIAISLKAEFQFLKNYTGDFQITFKKDSKLHNNVFSAMKKVGHRGYLSAKTAVLVDIGHIDGDVMLSW
jgi:hypothetical protein